MQRLNSWKLTIVAIGLLLILAAIFLAIRQWGVWFPVGILGTLMTGVGTVTHMTEVNRDPGRAARPDLGGRGTTPTKTKNADGKTVITEKRTRPRRPGRGSR